MEAGESLRGRPRAEDELAELAASVGPLRWVMAALAARLIDTRAPARLCFARLGDYARERLGLSARQLQDLARVHRALAGLPRLERALVANELPWSKLRLLARVATPDDEADWIDRARGMPTRRLEEVVREDPHRRDPGDPDDAPEETAPVGVHCSPYVREKWAAAKEMAERVAGGRLRAGDALELVLAEVFSSVGIDPAFTRWELPAPRGRGAGAQDREPSPSPRATPRELSGEVTALAQGLEDADAFEIDRRLRRAIRLEQTLDAAMAPLLRRVTAPDYEWRDRYQPLERYAPETLGMSVSKARALIRLERAGDVCPELRAAYRSGRLSWVKAHCLMPLLLLDVEGPWRAGWVAWAERVLVRRLERDVERMLLLRAGHREAFQRGLHAPERAQDPLPEDEQQLCAPDVDVDATQSLAWRVPREVAQLFVGVCATVRHRLWRARGRAIRDGEVFEALLDTAMASWLLREPGRRPVNPVMVRDDWRCAIPGCTSRRELHDHHIRFRSRGGSDEPGNRITLCAFHHQRCLHAGRLRVTGEAPDDLLFEIGLRSDGPPLAVYRSGDIAA